MHAIRHDVILLIRTETHVWDFKIIKRWHRLLLGNKHENIWHSFFMFVHAFWLYFDSVGLTSSTCQHVDVDARKYQSLNKQRFNFLISVFFFSLILERSIFLNIIVPLVGFSKPDIIIKRLVLPDPLSPTIPRVSPGIRSNEMLLTATARVSPAPKATRSSCRDKTGLIMGFPFLSSQGLTALARLVYLLMPFFSSPM